MLTLKAKRPGNGGLPSDIVQEILLRLPVKSLCRFKCVSKQWGALIGSPDFVNQHFCHESNQERLLIQHDGPAERQHAFALYFDDTYSRYEEPDHLQFSHLVETLIGPVNGVFCVVNGALDMALLNPATRQFKPLPLLHSFFEPHFDINGYSIGFGLDPLNGDFKIVWIQNFWNNEINEPHYPLLVSVYNSGSDSWRHFEDEELFDSVDVRRSPFNAYLNGVYYWLMELDDADVAVLAFNMSSEEFLDIQVPDCIESKERLINLALYGNSVALLVYDYPYVIDKCIDVWVMEKEGCWTRSYSVSPLHQDINWPICFLKDNELLTETKTSLILYDVSTKKSRTFEDRGNKYCAFLYWAFSYKESLVSVKGEGDNCKLWDTSSELVKEFFN